MRRLTHAVMPAALLLAAAVLALPATKPAFAQPPPVARQSLLVEPLSGQDIYTHLFPLDYRVGPNLMTTASGTTYQYNCGPTGFGDPRPAIRVASTTSTNGTGWSPETMLLQPSTVDGAGDAGGVCDPSVVKIGSYYFMAYTGISADGRRQVFAARSIDNPMGPFRRWNGVGWTNGDKPAAIAPVFPPGSGPSGPSLIVQGNTIYLYFTVQIGSGTYQTRLATAPFTASPVDQTTWPSRLQAQPETSIEHPEDYVGNDCVGFHSRADTDVKYDDTTGRFLAVTADQAYPWTVLLAYESTDLGETFTKATITRGDYQKGARTPGLLGDATGHIPAGAPTAIAYAHSTGCSADLHYSRTSQQLLTTGAVNEPLSSGTANWHPDSGSWGYLAGQGMIQSNSSPGLVAETTLRGRAATSSSTISVRMRSNTGPGRWFGMHFAKAHADDTIDESGYVAYVTGDSPPATKVCLTKAGFGTLACAPAGVSPGAWHNLRVVQAGGNIKAFVNGNPAQGVSVTDADDPFLGGYVGLVTYQDLATFNTFQISDNVPGSSASTDWTPNAGDWAISAGKYLVNRASTGQLNLQTNQGLDGNVLTQLGDGSYAASISITPGADPQAWAGLALADNGGFGSFARDGYLVFLRANGNLGVYKAGVGQVIADIPTGTNPTVRNVRIRVLKTGTNLQVYVNNLPDPFVNWTDQGSHAWAIGSFGVANLQTPATFSGVTYDGDGAR